jgi:hypothetical protein
MEKKKTSNAIEILHRRYIKDDAQRTASPQEERSMHTSPALSVSFAKGPG